MRKRAGFSLLELLVVVAIIVMLVALLLPALATAREKAYQTKCLSNQRDIAMAVQIWVQDHNETYPTASEVWDGIELPPEKLLCPTLRAELLSGKRHNPDVPRQNDYAYSHFLCGVLASVVKNPCLELLTGDYYFPDPAPVPLNPLFAPPGQQPSALNIFYQPSDFDYRHSDGFIASFCDGHVQLLHEPPADLAGAVDQFNRVGYRGAPLGLSGAVLRLQLRGIATGAGKPIRSAHRQIRAFDLAFAEHCRQCAVSGGDILMRDIPLQYRGIIKVVLVGAGWEQYLPNRFNIDPQHAPTIIFFNGGQQLLTIPGPLRIPGQPTDQGALRQYADNMVAQIYTELDALHGPCPAGQ